MEEPSVCLLTSSTGKFAWTEPIIKLPLCYQTRSPWLRRADGGTVHLEEDHDSTCQQGVLVSLHELNMVDLYWAAVLFTTTDARPSNYHCDCAQTLRQKKPFLSLTGRRGRRRWWEDLPGEGCHGGVSGGRLQGDNHWEGELKEEPCIWEVSLVLMELLTGQDGVLGSPSNGTGFHPRVLRLRGMTHIWIDQVYLARPVC